MLYGGVLFLVRLEIPQVVGRLSDELNFIISKKKKEKKEIFNKISKTSNQIKIRYFKHEKDCYILIVYERRIILLLSFLYVSSQFSFHTFNPLVGSIPRNKKEEFNKYKATTTLLEE